MVRMADIIKRKVGKKAKQIEVITSMKAEEAKPKVQIMADKEPVKEREEESKVDKKSSEQIYEEALALIRAELKRAQEVKPIRTKKVIDTVKKIVERIILDDRILINLTNRSTSDNYLLAHSVNVCILAINVGLALGYSRLELTELGTGAFLHDIGIAQMLEIAQRPRKLTEHEYEEVKKHPVYGAKILENAEDMIEAVVKTVYQHHERINGQGYPKGLKKKEIHPYAQIVGLVDAYEALSHPRSYRRIPYKAIKEIIDSSGEVFDPKLVKALINQVSIYPQGSWVRLSTGEIGKVTEINKNFPTRPKVSIVFGSDGSELAQVKSIDLKGHPTLYIKEAIAEDKLGLESASK